MKAFVEGDWILVCRGKEPKIRWNLVGLLAVVERWAHDGVYVCRCGDDEIVLDAANDEMVAHPEPGGAT